MKNYNTETQGFAAFVKKSIMLFVISTGFLSLSACNNKNENSNPVATNPYSYGTEFLQVVRAALRVLWGIFTEEQLNKMEFWRI